MEDSKETDSDCDNVFSLLRSLENTISRISHPRHLSRAVQEFEQLKLSLPLVKNCGLCCRETDDVTVYDPTDSGNDKVKISESRQITGAQMTTNLVYNSAHFLEKILLFSSKFGFIETVEAVLSKGVNVNASNKNDYTALHLAIIQDGSRSSHFQNVNGSFVAPEVTVKILLRAGIRVDAATKSGFTALHFAVLTECPKVVSILIEYGASLDLVFHYRKCLLALFGGQSLKYEVSTDSLSGVQNCETWEDSPITLLHFAVMNQQSDLVKQLLKNGASVNAVDIDGKTPLMSATESKCGKEQEMDVFHILIEFGADLNLKDVNGMTSFHHAIKNYKPMIAKDLLKRGVKVDTPEKGGKTPLMIAIEHGIDEMVNFLLVNGANVDLKNKDGLTPLHFACEYPKVNIVKMLLQAGADINLTCNSGMTPYDVAIVTERKFREMKDEAFRFRPFEMSSRGLCSFRPDGFSLYDRSMVHHQANLLLHILHSHVNMLDHFGLQLHPSHATSLVSKVMRMYSKNVTRMVETFKRSFVTNDLTVSQLLRAGDPVYVLNEEVMLKLMNVMMALRRGETGERIRNIMSFVVRKAKRKLKLLDEGQIYILDVFKKSGKDLPVLPVEMSRKILSYLNEEEISLVLKV